MVWRTEYKGRKMSEYEEQQVMVVFEKLYDSSWSEILECFPGILHLPLQYSGSSFVYLFILGKGAYIYVALFGTSISFRNFSLVWSECSNLVCTAASKWAYVYHLCGFYLKEQFLNEFPLQMKFYFFLLICMRSSFNTFGFFWVKNKIRFCV